MASSRAVGIHEKLRHSVREAIHHQVGSLLRNVVLDNQSYSNNYSSKTDSRYFCNYPDAKKHLVERLNERAPGRIQLLAGPRQVGKTTLLLELAAHYGDRAFYAAGDTLEAGLPGFWEHLVERAESEARKRRKAVLLVDEVQHLADWAARLKAEWDRLRRVRIPLQIVATGSSALSIGSGSRESLAGRFERITLSHWSASELVEQLGARSAEAPRLVARMGSYPGAFAFRKNVARWRAYIRDAIIEPAIGRDVLALGSVRRPALLRQVFALCADMPAQVVSLQKLQSQLRDPGALETIANYLHLLEEAYFVAALEKYSARALRRRKSPPKLIMLNNALLSAMHPDGIPDQTTEPARFGTWVENACLAHAWNAGQRVTYWREEPLEVDAVFEGSWGAWAVEIKTGRLDTASLRGLLEFCRRNRKFRPLVLSGRGGSSAARRAGIEVMPWEGFLLNGPPNHQLGTVFQPGKGPGSSL